MCLHYLTLPCAQDEAADPLSAMRDEPLDTPRGGGRHAAFDEAGPSTQFSPDMPPPSYTDSVYFDPRAGSLQASSEIMPAPPSASVAGPSRASGSGVTVQQRASGGTFGWPPVAVTVHSPEKRADSGASPLHRAVRGTYVAFAVTWQARDVATGALIGPPGAAGTTVRRRFRDFCSLYDALHAALPGAVLPPRPEKKLEGAVGDGGSDAFLADRTRLLGEWLNALAAHPLVSASPLFSAFLSPDDDVWRAAAAGAQAPGPASIGDVSSPVAGLPAPPSPLLKALRDLSASVTQSNIAAAASTGHPADASILASKAAHAAMVRALAVASAKAERYVGKCVAHCDALGDTGLAFVRLSRFEDAEAARRGRFAPAGAAQRLAAGEVRAMGAACVRACRLGRAATAATASAMAPLHHHQALAPAVDAALADREAALHTWQAAVADAQNKRAIATKAQADPGAGPRKGMFGRGEPVALLDLHAAADAAEAAEVRAKGSVDAVSATLQAEFQRLSVTRSVEFSAMGLGVARVHCSAGERGETIWWPLAEGVSSRHVDKGPGEEVAAVTEPSGV